MVIGATHYMVVAGLLFVIGAAGFLLRRNLIILFMSVELMLNAVNLALLTVARFFMHSLDGQVMAFLMMALAAAETAVGLSILIAVYRIKKGVSADELTSLHG